jgi:hypothetical protein
VVLLAVTVIVAGLIPRPGRAAILRPPMLLTLVIAVLIVWPHALWVTENLHGLKSAAEDAKLTKSLNMFKSLGSLAMAVFSAVGPACAILLMFFAPAWRSRVERNPVRFSGMAFAILAGGMVITVALLTDIPHVKARWLLPLVVVVPVLLVAHLDPASLSTRRILVFRGLCAAIALGVLTLMGVRTLGPKLNDQLDQYAYPFDQVADEIKGRLGREPVVIVSNLAFVAGNLKVRFPESTTYIAGMRNAELVENVQRHGPVLVWQSLPRGRIPPELVELFQVIEPDRVRPPRVFEITPRDETLDSSRTLAMIVLRPQEKSVTPTSSH